MNDESFAKNKTSESKSRSSDSYFSIGLSDRSILRVCIFQQWDDGKK